MKCPHGRGENPAATTSKGELMSERIGPKTVTTLSCEGCQFREVVAGKHRVDCTAHNRALYTTKGDTKSGWHQHTPSWCPHLPDTKPCEFHLSWQGKCGVIGCQKHKDLKCVSCGAPAVRDCGQTIGPMCCGVFLCADCRHSLAPDGLADLGGLHVTKEVFATQVKYSKEVFTPLLNDLVDCAPSPLDVGERELIATVMEAAHASIQETGVGPFEPWKVLKHLYECYLSRASLRGSWGVEACAQTGTAEIVLRDEIV